MNTKGWHRTGLPNDNRWTLYPQGSEAGQALQVANSKKIPGGIEVKVVDRRTGLEGAKIDLSADQWATLKELVVGGDAA